jgi:hypothetical protein
LPADDVNEILQRIARLETKIDMIISSKEIANEASQSARSAHRRVDEVNISIEAMKQTQKWVIGILISGIGVFVGGFTLLLRVID